MCPWTDEGRGSFLILAYEEDNKRDLYVGGTSTLGVFSQLLLLLRDPPRAI